MLLVFCHVLPQCPLNKITFMYTVTDCCLAKLQNCFKEASLWLAMSQILVRREKGQVVSVWLGICCLLVLLFSYSVHQFNPKYIQCMPYR